MSSKSYLRLGTTLWILTALFALLPSWPYIYYRLSPEASNNLASTLASTISEPALLASRSGSREGAEGGRVSQGGLKPTLSPSPNQEPITNLSRVPPRENQKLPSPSPNQEPITKNQKLPSLDPSLPKQNGLIIDKIGVRGQIHEGDDWQSILKKGIWRVPGFGTPPETTTTQSTKNQEPGTKNSPPVILAAHRWGYLDWSAGFRKLNSFYNLPKLAVGDTIKIVWEQREYEYKVYSVKSGTQIPEYNADLILYTCQLWNSPVRFFVMANRTN